MKHVKQTITVQHYLTWIVGYNLIPGFRLILKFECFAN